MAMKSEDNNYLDSMVHSEEEEPLQQQDAELPNEQELRRILQCKRLSEGCNRFNLPNYLARKNSLHSTMMQDNSNGSLLPPVTEGVPMQLSAGCNNNALQYEPNSETGSSSTSSRSGSIGNRLSLNKRHSSSQDGETSCSSSVSLDGKGSPTGIHIGTRRRSSTVSQCSSVLSEGTRQQLNFDLSPDLAPDSSILEANALNSPVDFEIEDQTLERPMSPEPLSTPPTERDPRPASRMSFGGGSQDEQIVQTNELFQREYSPDSTLGDSHRDDEDEPHQDRQMWEIKDTTLRNHEDQIRDNLERLISEVSSVKVSGNQFGVENGV